jgi:hypothetical protein
LPSLWGVREVVERGELVMLAICLMTRPTGLGSVFSVLLSLSHPAPHVVAIVLKVCGGGGWPGSAWILEVGCV